MNSNRSAVAKLEASQSTIREHLADTAAGDVKSSGDILRRQDVGARWKPVLVESFGFNRNRHWLARFCVTCCCWLDGRDDTPGFATV